MASPPEGSRQHRPSPSQAVHGYILFGFAIALALMLAYLMRQILLMLYVSVLFAVVLMPVVRGVMRLRIKRWYPNRAIAIVLLLLGIFGAAALFLTFALPPVLRDLSSFTKELPTRAPQLLDKVKDLPLAGHLNVSALNSKIQGYASNFVEYIFLSISDWASGLADIVAVLVLMIYFMLEGDIAYRWVLSFFPKEMRLRLDNTLTQAERRMGRWLVGQGLLMLLMGVCSAVAFSLLKIRYSYALGVLMGVLNIVPIFGGLCSMILVVLVAAIDSWGKVVGALIFYAIYTQVENTYLTPRVMQSSVDLAGLGVLVALLVGSKLAGVAGAMVAVPTAVLAAVLIQEYLVKHDEAG